MFTARKRSLGQGNVFTPVSQSFCSQGGSAIPPDRHLLARHLPELTPPGSACWDTVNKRAVRIPLECNLVYDLFFMTGRGTGDIDLTTESATDFLTCISQSNRRDIVGFFSNKITSDRFLCFVSLSTNIR